MTVLPKFSTERLHIQHLGACDAEVVLSYYLRNREFLTPFYPRFTPEFFTMHHWDAQIKRSIQEFQQESAVRFVFFAKDTLEALGTANLTQIFRGPFQASFLGFAVSAKHEGRGLMHEGLHAVIRYAFEELNLHRIMATHLTENTRSARLLERLGFEAEGVAKKYLFINGEWRDHVLRSLTNELWTIQ